MRKVGVVFLVFSFLMCMSGPVFAGGASSSEIDQLKGEVQKLLNRIQELEKKQSESGMKRSRKQQQNSSRKRRS
jgi:outer membrane murein-binding lipoprotein Lpp